DLHLRPMHPPARRRLCAGPALRGGGRSAMTVTATPATLAPGPAPAPSPADLLDAVRLHDPNADLELVRRCFAFAAERHAGQLRRSGEPYVVHPLAVSRLIADLRLDVASVCAGLLHDCVE